MEYDVDYDYHYELSDGGLRIIPKGTVVVGELYVLPNGRYMPPGIYRDPGSGMDIIYEPWALSPFRGFVVDGTEDADGAEDADGEGGTDE
ncbi:MAG: hypothetical protein UHI81_10945 [Olegusella sp.]|nr:hypothetical protein [Olegusella sp.]